MTKAESVAQALKYAETFASTAGIDGLRAKTGLPALKAGTVSCLKCSRDFTSEDKTRNRICFICKRTGEWQGSRESDSIYPAMPSVTAFKKGAGVKTQSELFKHRPQTKRKKKPRTKAQKQFGDKPLSKRRTRA